MRRLKNIGDVFIPAIVIVFLLVSWEAVVRIFHIEAWLLPGPVQIGHAFIESGGLLIQHTGVTLFETLVGFFLAISLAFLVASLMEESPTARKAVYPFVISSQTIPIISVAPLFQLWFGYGFLPKIIVVVLVCFFPVTISLMSGFKSIDRGYVELFRSMNASRWATFRMVKLPMAMPSFFSGLKISASYAVMGAIIGEWLGAQDGIGIYMIRSQHSFLGDRVFAAITVITLLSLALFALVAIAERLIIPWHKYDQQ